MPLYENVLPTGANLQAPFGFDYMNVVSCTRVQEKQADQTSWLQDGVPACQQALNQGDRVGLIFIARSNIVTWDAGAQNYTVELTKDYLFAACAIPPSVQANWVPGEMLRWYHCKHVGMQANSTQWTKIRGLWRATGGFAKVDQESIEMAIQALRKQHGMRQAMAQLAKIRRAGGCEGVSNQDAYGWLGTFPAVAPQPATTPWVRGVKWKVGVVTGS
jgi:hypothetical protein